MLSTLSIIDAAVASSASAAAPSLTTTFQHTIAAHPLIFTAIVASVLLLFLLPALLDRSKRLPNEPPTVASYVPFLGSALSFSANPHAFLTACRARYGSCFTVNLAGRRMTFVTSPLDYAAVFKHKELSFATVANKIAHDVLDQSKQSIGVAHIDAAVHSQYAKYLSGDGLEELTRNSYVQIREWMRRDKAAHFTGAQQYRQSGLREWITDLGFEAGVQAIFGEGLTSPQLKSNFFAFDNAFPLLVGGAPSFVTSAGRKARSALIGLMGVREARDGEASLISARRELFNANSDLYDLHDVGATQSAMLWAAIANTIPAAFWTLAFLMTNPPAMAAVQKEVAEVLGAGRSLDEADAEGDEWTREQCARLKLTDAAILEALRLVTGSMVMRLSTAPTTLTLHTGRTLDIRAGDGVVIYPALTHLDARVFPSPEQFVVDRFLDNPTPTLDGQRVAQALMPFGAGVSMCPGRHWARNEILVLVAMLVQRCDWRVEAGVKVPPVDYMRVGIGVYQPKGDMAMQYRYK